MKAEEARAFTVATDESLCALISGAKDRIVFVAPGITEEVAKALGRKFSDDKVSVTVVLDSDPEVYRLGLGTLEGLTALKELSDSQMLPLRRQEGIRIGLVVADDQTLIYSPIPQLVEAGSTSVEKPNALLLRGATADKLCEASGASEHSTPMDAEIGRAALTPAAVEAIQKDVQNNPPEPFDLTQKRRVFSSKLQFVEFSVERYQLTRQTVPVPAYLMGLAGDMQDRWRNSIRLLDMEDTVVSLEMEGIDGQKKIVKVDQMYIDDQRKKIEKRFLIPVVGFGTVMFKSDQDSFEKVTKAFDDLLRSYFLILEKQLGEKRLALISSVVEKLLPSVKANPPEAYLRFGAPSGDDIAGLLRQDIESAVSIKTLLKQHRVKKVYKDIAYQSVKSDDFQTQLRMSLVKAKVPATRLGEIFRESNAVLEKGGLL